MEWLKELLGEELFKQVQEKLGDTKIIKDEGNWIPKQRFDEVNQQKNEYKKMVEERDKQLEDLRKKAKDNEELNETIKQLQQQNEETVKQYEAKVQQLQFDHALDAALVKAKARNSKAVKALLNTELIKLDGDKLLGLDEQLKALQESDGYLFGEEPPAKGGGDFSGGNPGNQPNPWKKDTFNLTQQGKILRENPALAEKLMREAGVKR